jgi:hypothetical protein
MKAAKKGTKAVELGVSQPRVAQIIQEAEKRGKKLHR